MNFKCPVCSSTVRVHHPREGKILQCDECRRELKLIKSEQWELTVFEREKEERFL